MQMMHRSNFVSALRQAIEVQQAAERTQGYLGQSAYLGGLREVLEAALRGERIEITSQLE